jgi:ribosomal protein S18 acetylase RimI-like enzyme
MPTIAHLDTPTEEERSAITAPLGAHSSDQGFVWNPARVTLALREGDAIHGGLIGYAQWDWLYIEILGVSTALRGRGWGRRLIEAAEEFARRESCHGIWLSTFTFQAPAFYERMGFIRCGEIADHPAGQSRLFYMKRLDTVGHT